MGLSLSIYKLKKTTYFNLIASLQRRDKFDLKIKSLHSLRFF